MKIFLTGASGFIGSHLLGSLIGSGHEVICAVRSELQEKAMLERGAQAWPGDLFDSGTLAKGLQGVETFIHAAGCRDISSSKQVLDTQNALLTQAVLVAAEEAGVSQFIFIGAASVVIPGPIPMMNIDETYPIINQEFLPYIRSKARAEQRVLTARSKKMRTVVLRPTFVWGSGDSIDSLIGPAVERGQFGWFSGGRYPFSVCSVMNLCEAVEKTLAYSGTEQIFFISDREPVDFRSFISARLTASGYPISKFTISRRLAWWLARFTENGWKYLPLPGRPPLVREMICLMGYPFTVSIQRAVKELGYEATQKYSP